MQRGARVLVPLLVVAALVLAPGTASNATGTKITGNITVSAASSLTEAFTTLGKQFEKRHRGTDVMFNFHASSALVIQIQQGAPVDVFASADEANMDKLVEGGEVTASPVQFAGNKLEIAVKPDNPSGVQALDDLADVGIVALCAADVPCGKYADAALDAAGVAIPTDRITRAANAKATLTTVSAGDADAAIVYVTDGQAAGTSVERVRIPDTENQIATYPIAPLEGSQNAPAARAFTKYVASGAGRKVLSRFGFLEP